MGKKIFYALALCSFAILGISLASATPASAVDCIGSAKSAFGDDYVNTYITAFNTRCDTNAGQGISDGPYTYGFAAPVSTNFEHTTALSGGSFSFDFQRIIYSGRCETNSKGKCYKGTNENGSYSSNNSYVTFSGDNIDCWTDGSGKSKWYACKGLTATVSNSAITSGDSDPIEQNFGFTSCLYGNSAKCRDNTLYYKVYKGTEVHHDTPNGAYGTTAFTNDSTSSSSPIIVGDGKLVFNHYLSRNDGWSSPSTASLSSVYKRSFTLDGTATSTGADGSWKDVSLSKPNGTNQKVTHEINISDLGLQPNTAKKVCSVLTHKDYKSIGGHSWSLDSESRTSTSTICVWVKDDRIFLNPGSRSRASNSIQLSDFAYSDGGSQTADSWAGSRGGSKTYSYSFTHQLKLQGDTGYAYNNIQYYVTETKNGTTSNVAGSVNAPLTAQTINSGNNNYVTVSTSNGTFDPIDAGGTTPTICQTIYFRPKTIQVKISSGVTTETDAKWQSSTACAVVRRRNTKTSTMSGTCSTTINGTLVDQSNPQKVFSTHSPFQFMFGFNIDRNNTTQGLGTTYTITRSIDGGASTVVKTNAITVPKTGITDSPQIAVAEGTSKKVCETISVNPSSYTIHTEADGSESTVQSGDSFGGSRELVTCCGTAAVPKREPRDDGEITVYSESEGSLDNPNQTGGYSEAQGAWLIKTASADITYTHKLWREAEKHTGDGVHQADVRSPEEDVTVRYRFDDPSASFAATSITAAHTSTIATNTANSKYTFKSVSTNANPTDQLLNANTVATASEVGKHYSYCQSDYYVSEKYTLRGIYWQVDGEIYAGEPSLQGVQDPVSKEIVGKSAAACVDVIRPWNFRATALVPSSDTSTPVTVGSAQSVSFKLTVGKNADDYLITDIPNANIRLVAFTVGSESALSTNFSGSIDSASDPCAHFEAQTGAQCDVIRERQENIGASSPTGTKFYPTIGDYNHTINFQGIVIPDRSTSEKYCVAVGVQPTNSGDGFNFSSNWAISNATCYNIGKYPNFQVWGGSTFTNGGIKTSHTTIDNKIFGSWDDFALIANKNIIKTGSGASLISSMSASGSTNCNLSPLTIANSKCNSLDTSGDIPLGGAGITVGTTNFVQKLEERYLVDPDKYIVTSIINRDTLRSGTNPYVIYNAGNIVITSDITPTGSANRSYATPNIPQVIVIAKNNIYITEDVHNVNAWLISKEGFIDTCVRLNGDGSITRLNDGASPKLSANICTNTLNISGPVVANKVYFNRTANGDAHTNTLPDYAELVDLSSAVYLFSANEASGAQPITTYLQKLPPRY